MMKKIFLVAIVLGLGIWFGLEKATFNPEKILENSQLKERQFKGKTVEISALDDKVKAYLMEEHSVPLVAVSFGFDKAGKAYETVPGTLLLATSVMLDGAGEYSRKELRQLMKEKGIKIGVSAENDRLAFSLSYVKEFEEDAFKVLRAVLYQPHMAKSDLDLTRKQLQAARLRRLEKPQYYLNRLVDTKFYGEHPYGRDDIPDEKSLNAISSDDIKAYLKAAMGKDNLKVGIAGDIDIKQAEAFLENVFSDLKDKAEVADLPSFSPNYDADRATEDVPFSAQSFVLAAGKGIKRLDDDFYPLYIANYVLGGSGLTSRFNKAVREKEGLTYGIYSYFTNSDALDTWQIYFSATPENADKALKIAAEEYQMFYHDGISENELEEAKRGLLSSFNLRFASLFDIAEMLEQMQVQKLGIDFLIKRQDMVAAVTLDEVNRAIREKMPKSLERGQMRLFEVKGQKK